MAENLQHEDFGEKIGGAKKDLWKDRGLYVDDLGAMNEREAEKFVKKDNVWKKPDYQAMLDDGVPLGVVYFIKKARDSLGASPQYRYSDKTPELRRARQEEYIETVRQLQAVIEDVRAALKQRVFVGCTGCKYCMPCPFGVDIPRNFKLMNDYEMYSNERALKSGWNFIDEGARATACKKCGKCERACPQRLPIRQKLAEIAERMNESGLNPPVFPH